MVVEVMAVVVWVLGWFGKLVFSMRRNARQGVDAEFIVMAVARGDGLCRCHHHRPLHHRHLHLSPPPPPPLAQLCRVFADVFFFLLFGIAGWLYILYKGQDEVYVLMPDGLEAERLFYAFRATLCCVFGAKCVHIAWIIRTQTQHDVFFIDWEQPKGGADDAETANADRSGGRACRCGARSSRRTSGSSCRPSGR